MITSIFIIIILFYLIQIGIMAFVHILNGSRIPYDGKDFLEMTFMPIAIFNLKEYKIDK